MTRERCYKAVHQNGAVVKMVPRFSTDHEVSRPLCDASVSRRNSTAEKLLIEACLAWLYYAHTVNNESMLTSIVHHSVVARSRPVSCVRSTNLEKNTNPEGTLVTRRVSESFSRKRGWLHGR